MDSIPKIPYLDYEQEESPRLIPVSQILTCGVVDIPRCLHDKLIFEIYYAPDEEIQGNGIAYSEQEPYLINYCYGLNGERQAWMGLAHEIGHCMITHLQLPIPKYTSQLWVPVAENYLDDFRYLSWALAPLIKEELEVILLHEALAWSIAAKLYKRDDWDDHEVLRSINSYRQGVLATVEERDEWVVRETIEKCW